MSSNTTYQDVIDSFDSSFQDKFTLPALLVRQWFLKAVGIYNAEIGGIEFDTDNNEFTSALDRYTIDSLAEIMKCKYQERELSRVNKMNNIIGKDISLNSTGDTKKYTDAELAYVKSQVDIMLNKQKTPAYK
jgi:hypothetical protein